ncbi:Regulator of chromosome condensation (RCC1) repeat-containing protein [Nannocystis exedens]|uniref:Regulator of chromosome condensation (RCC1) repeat-containing protein n=1 Tax=Nannocystis exedens TaxID=54 RepID=A0A1I2EFX5_9BACT|nr:hypothetical protein [Nannocystis exedens]PCC74735.1 Regulator of chromosome condensation (RCC1) repeat protein [Nannocystis exedens]SFE91775.1 Regulator of chromosome condensation (RCC1) repeat-containing protein [Nannocystis exedens]
MHRLVLLGLSAAGCSGGANEASVAAQQTEPAIDAPVVCWGSIVGEAPPAAHPIAAGTLLGTGQQVCALGPEGLACFGNGAPGQEIASDTPAPFAPAPHARALALGSSHGCALEKDGSVTCWGGDLVGQLGRGNEAPAGAIGAIDLRTGEVVLPEGASRGSDRTAQVVDLADVVQLAAGSSHTCARTSTGAVRCWGAGRQGQLGNGGKDFSTRPVDVTGLTDAVDLAASNAWTCAVRRDATVWCWGSADQYPTGEAVPDELVPVAIAGFRDIVALSMRQVGDSTSEQTTCALDRGGAVWCADSRRPPRRIDGIADAIAIASGVHHTCALTAGGEVLCFGSNDRRQLGVEQPEQPVVRVPGVAGAKQIAAGRFFTCALRTSPTPPNP